MNEALARACAACRQELLAVVGSGSSAPSGAPAPSASSAPLGEATPSPAPDDPTLREEEEPPGDFGPAPRYLVEERYEVLEELGRGGMGVVYLARDRRFSDELGGVERRVVVKRILRVGERAKERFLRETRAVAAIEHENVVSIYDFGRDEQGPYIVMAYVGGGTLRERAKQRPLTAEEFYEIARGLGRALDYLHENAVLHRDVKPSNVLLTPQGVPVLSDFGLVRIGDASSDLSATGRGMGTQDYAAPEQKRGDPGVDQRADIYGLGATLYYALTGDAPRTIRESRVPTQWRPLVLRCVEDDPARRFSSAKEFLGALERARERSSSASSPSATLEVSGTVCANCHALNRAGQRYCRHCGAGLFRTCPRCRQESEASVQFCAQCGLDIPAWLKSEEHLRAAQDRIESLDWEGAIQSAERSVEAWSGNADARRLLGRARKNQTALLNALDAGQALYEQDRLEESRAAWRRVLELAPQHARARAELEAMPERIRGRDLQQALEQLHGAVHARRWSEVEAGLARAAELAREGDRPALAAAREASAPLRAAAEDALAGFERCLAAGDDRGAEDALERMAEIGFAEGDLDQRRARLALARGARGVHAALADEDLERAHERLGALRAGAQRAGGTQLAELETAVARLRAEQVESGARAFQRHVRAEELAEARAELERLRALEAPAALLRGLERSLEGAVRTRRRRRLVARAGAALVVLAAAGAAVTLWARKHHAEASGALLLAIESGDFDRAAGLQSASAWPPRALADARTRREYDHVDAWFALEREFSQIYGDRSWLGRLDAAGGLYTPGAERGTWTRVEEQFTQVLLEDLEAAYLAAADRVQLRAVIDKIPDAGLRAALDTHREWWTEVWSDTQARLARPEADELLATMAPALADPRLARAEVSERYYDWLLGRMEDLDEPPRDDEGLGALLGLYDIVVSVEPGPTREHERRAEHLREAHRLRGDETMVVEAAQNVVEGGGRPTAYLQEAVQDERGRAVAALLQQVADVRVANLAELSTEQLLDYELKVAELGAAATELPSGAQQEPFSKLRTELEGEVTARLRRCVEGSMNVDRHGELVLGRDHPVERCAVDGVELEPLGDNRFAAEALPQGTARRRFVLVDPSGGRAELERLLVVDRAAPRLAERGPEALDEGEMWRIELVADEPVRAAEAVWTVRGDRRPVELAWDGPRLTAVEPVSIAPGLVPPGELGVTGVLEVTLEDEVGNPSGPLRLDVRVPSPRWTEAREALGRGAWHDALLALELDLPSRNAAPQFADLAREALQLGWDASGGDRPPAEAVESVRSYHEALSSLAARLGGEELLGDWPRLAKRRSEDVQRLHGYLKATRIWSAPDHFTNAQAWLGEKPMADVPPWFDGWLRAGRNTLARLESGAVAVEGARGEVVGDSLRRVVHVGTGLVFLFVEGPEPFYLCETEVSREAWERGLGRTPPTGPDALLPRDDVTWLQARDWCRANGMRLPTESEWERAAGAADARGAAPCCSNADRPHPVRPAHEDRVAAGFLDMAGNLMEWCADVDRRDLLDGGVAERDGYRVLRGGSFRHSDESRTVRTRRTAVEGDALRSRDSVGLRPALQSRKAPGESGR